MAAASAQPQRQTARGVCKSLEGEDLWTARSRVRLGVAVRVLWRGGREGRAMRRVRIDWTFEGQKGGR